MSQFAKEAKVRTVTISSTGRLTLPADARRALGLQGEGELEIEVDEQRHALVLRVVVRVPDEDAWAYTDQHRRQLARALADSGRVQTMSEADLRALAPSD